MNNGILYIKGTCTVCRGKALGCYSCDSDGLTYIEAADTVIAEWLKNLPEDRKEKLCNLVTYEQK
jgi:hypothetical protein